jgi:hypothetical protein
VCEPTVGFFDDSAIGCDAGGAFGTNVFVCGLCDWLGATLGFVVTCVADGCATGDELGAGKGTIVGKLLA